MKKFFISLAFLTALLNPALVYAQTTTTTTTSNASNLPQYNKGVDTSIRDYLCTPSNPPDGHDLERCINRVYKFGVAFGAIALVFFVVYAGYTYMVSGEAGKSKAKSMIWNALTGMGILLASYVILYFINPSLTTVKVIQPPIFQSNLPDCADVGLGEDCTLGNGQVAVGTGSGGSKVVPTCTEGLVTVGSLGLPSTKGSNIQICKTLGNKLKAAYANRGNVNWTITATIESGHESGCHDSSDPRAGNCADIAINGNPRTMSLWNSLCSTLVSQGLSNIANEIAPRGVSDLASYNSPSCGDAKDKTKDPYTKSSDAPSIHVNYTGG